MFEIGVCIALPMFVAAALYGTCLFLEAALQLVRALRAPPGIPRAVALSSPRYAGRPAEPVGDAVIAGWCDPCGRLTRRPHESAPCMRHPQ